MLVRYREPRVVTALIWVYHLMILSAGVAGLVGGPPLSVEMVAGDSLWLRVWWSSLFLVCGLLGVACRVKDRAYPEAIAFVGAGVAMLIWVASALTVHAGGGPISWQTVIRFCATATLSVVAGVVRWSYARQQVSYESQLSQAVASAARQARQQVTGETL
jgi:hypothetical protein